MIRWKFKKNENEAFSTEVKQEFVFDILEMKTHLITVNENINEDSIEYFQKNWKMWIDRWESEEEYLIDPDKFSPVAMALTRKTFPDLFANKVCGVQPMKTPVGLSYATRVICDDKSNPNNGVE
ncbi:MAG: hypothetical protein ACOC5T_08635 [Elusimicrobiota bacterium]